MPQELLCLFVFANLKRKGKFSETQWMRALERVDPLIIKSSLWIVDLQPYSAYQQSPSAVSVGKANRRDLHCLSSSISADVDESPGQSPSPASELPPTEARQRKSVCVGVILPPTFPRVAGGMGSPGSFSVDRPITTIKSYKNQS